ncbi:MAG: phosphoribosylaminoimidazolesuccinocarboxamide synthase [Gammaproteobacteria bacterium]
MEKRQQLYSGKAKTVYATDDPNLLIMHYRNDISAFNAQKLANLERKGLVNNYFNAYIMQQLATGGVRTHFEKVLNDHESLMKRLVMLPVECVVRNIAAGSLCKRLGIAEGTEFATPIFEFFYKNDALGDPFINECHILAFNWATQADIDEMKHISLKVNQILRPLFAAAGMLLVDFKLEFGRFDNQLLLGDEFTPDGCRIWDQQTREKMDKDRFRQDLGQVIDNYEQVARRLGINLPA